MKNNIVLAGPPHPYQRQFQMALLNLARITSEENLLKRLKQSNKKIKAHD